MNELIKEIRELTGAGMLDIKEALEQNSDDKEAAIAHLRKNGAIKMAKKADRVTKEGIVESYLHGGRIGVLLELNCETDFVARTDDFKQLGRELAMHIAASGPQYIAPSDVPAAVVASEKAIYREQASGEGKPEDIVDKMIAGRLQKFYEEVCLLEQPFVKDPNKKISDLLGEAVAKIGENIQIRRFTRYVLGN